MVVQNVLYVPGIEHAEVRLEEIPRVVVIIPAYNEERDIARVVQDTREILSKLTKEFSIIVVDDDSVDNTRNILDSFEIDRFYHRKNLGKGDVIRNALKFVASGEIVVTMDGDGEHDPRDLPRLIEPILHDRADIVIGSRFLNQTSRYLGRAKNDKHIKNLGNRFYTILLWIFTRKVIHDTQSGFRVFKANKVKCLNLCSDGFRIEMEMTVKALRRGFKIAEVAIQNGQGHRKSHLKLFADGTKIAMTVLRECLPKRTKRLFDWMLPRIPNRLGRFVN
ncbi:MAG TPA: glycosyltransferase family 2 protein [Candidatus Lokiarchaeia archaeon]|nr:glycosyltransferase family 2 protein [Candidatus Lokiarchaeia archaeon]